MLTQQAIVDFCSQYDYDIRKSGNGRWIDQKCAADVVTVVADCIYNYALQDEDGIFTTPEIWHCKYTVENVEAIFKKPGVESKAAKNEYDKFFQQPMEMLANANVLKKIKQGNRNFYKVNNMAVLEYIALRERNALFFLKTYIMLMYNRNNFRDVYAVKPKGITRKEYAAAHPVEVNEAYYHYQSAKAKRYLRLFNDQNRSGQTEHLESAHMSDKAIHMHHIFPEATYPEICYYLENIIALTPTQHLNYAHPDGHTQEIDEQYQHLLLLSKADRIKENLTDPTVEKIYEFSNFLFVLNVGFDNDDVLDIPDMDFCAVVNAINVHYSIIER